MPKLQRADFYNDESGNFGPSYLDAAQPFHVTGARLFPDSGNEAASLAVEDAQKGISPLANKLNSSGALREDRQCLIWNSQIMHSDSNESPNPLGAMTFSESQIRQISFAIERAKW